MSDGKRIVIVGGVAGGASCAARARRLDEDAEITIFERGPHVSFGSCGLPYYVGDVIRDEDDLLLVTPERFRERFRIDVRVRTEVTAVDAARRVVTVKDLSSGEEREVPYDALVIATGASPLRPPFPGVDLPRVFTIRTVPDTTRLRAVLEEARPAHAVVVGAGFIGVEMTENLHKRGLAVSLVELDEQVLRHLDPEMARLVERELVDHGVDLRLGRRVVGIFEDGDRLAVELDGGERVATDLVILALGVRPETTLAKMAGLSIGPLGGVAVDEGMRTSDPHVWAVGDVVEKTCATTGRQLMLPMAGPANRQGRVAADTIAGRQARFRGAQGTAVCGVFDATVASTGSCQKQLRRAGHEHEAAIYLHPQDHVSYYPGAEVMHLKLVFDTRDGRILGAQAVGGVGVVRRIDVIAMAHQLGATVYDLEEAELCYAPQYGSPKDPVNMAGMIAANALRGDVTLASWDELGATDAMIVDVRETHEFEAGHVPGAVNVPLSVLRDRMGELPTDREIWLYCLSGKRSYDASRALAQHGLTVRNLPGGMQTWRALQALPSRS